MVFMKRLRMDTKYKYFTFIKNPVNRGHYCSDNVLFRILVNVRMSPEGELFEIWCNIQIIHVSP